MNGGSSVGLSFWTRPPFSPLWMAMVWHGYEICLYFSDVAMFEEDLYLYNVA